MYTFYLGSRPTVVMCGYQVLKEALIDHAEEFSGRGEFPAVQMYSKGNGKSSCIPCKKVIYTQYMYAWDTVYVSFVDKSFCV